jgi:hypothetical protein
MIQQNPNPPGIFGGDPVHLAQSFQRAQRNVAQITNW